MEHADTDTDPGAAGRALARARWHNRGLDRALEVIRDRRGDLDEAQRAELRALGGEEARDE